MKLTVTIPDDAWAAFKVLADNFDEESGRLHSAHHLASSMLKDYLKAIALGGGDVNLTDLARITANVAAKAGGDPALVMFTDYLREPNAGGFGVEPAFYEASKGGKAFKAGTDPGTWAGFVEGVSGGGAGPEAERQASRLVERILKRFVDDLLAGAEEARRYVASEGAADFTYHALRLGDLSELEVMRALWKYDGEEGE